MRKRIIAMLAAAALAAVPVCPQDIAAVQPGTRVRVTASSVRPEPWQGIVRSIDAEKLVLEPERSPSDAPPPGGAVLLAVIPRAAIETLEDLTVALDPGRVSRVRIRSSRGESIVGTLAGVDRESLTLVLAAAPDEVHRLRTIPRGEIASFEVSAGAKRGSAKGALIGGVIGLGVNLGFLALVLGSGNLGNAQHDTTGPNVVTTRAASASTSSGSEIGAVLFWTSPTLLGVLLGARIGGSGERWTPLAVPQPKLALRLAPASGHGVQAALSLSF
jgi:hypothetical protein